MGDYSREVGKCFSSFTEKETEEHRVYSEKFPAWESKVVYTGKSCSNEIILPINFPM